MWLVGVGLFVVIVFLEAASWIGTVRYSSRRHGELLDELDRRATHVETCDCGCGPCPGCHGSGEMLCLGQEACMNPLFCDGKTHECPVCDGAGRIEGLA